MEHQDNVNGSRGNLQKVADFLPYPFIIAEIFDGKHQNTYLNEKFSEEIGYTLDEIPTIETWYEHAYPDDAYRHTVISAWNQEEINSRKEGKVFVRMKSQVTCKNGNKRWYEVKASVINTIHVVAFVDLDKEMASQEELKSINVNNDRMLSILGHDLRSPVANLMSLSSLAAHTEISKDEFTALIQMINEQSTHVLEMLDNTLNWAKLNFNAISINAADIDFNTMVRNILAIYEIPIANKKITVNVAIEDSGCICSDLEIVTIIIRNLVSNAIKFTPQNGTITLQLSKNKFLLRDTGIGMPSAVIANIAGNQYTSRKGTDEEHGKGMGLQLVKTLAEKIDCKLDIQSEEFAGTEVSLVFKMDGE